MLLAKALQSQLALPSQAMTAPEAWLSRYCQIMQGPAGEFVQTTTGQDLLKGLLQSLALQTAPASWDAEASQLTVTQATAFRQVL